MGKLYEIFQILQIQKRIVSAETIRRNTVLENWLLFLSLSNSNQRANFKASPRNHSSFLCELLITQNR